MITDDDDICVDLIFPPTIVVVKLQYYLLTYIHTYLHTTWSRVLLEKLTGFQLVRKVPAMYTTWRFITAFTIAHHLSLSWASSIKSIPLRPTSWRSILILSSQVVCFPQVSPPKPCACLFSPPYTPTVLQSVKTHKNIDWSLPAMQAWRHIWWTKEFCISWLFPVLYIISSTYCILWWITHLQCHCSHIDSAC